MVTLDVRLSPAATELDGVTLLVFVSLLALTSRAAKFKLSAVLRLSTPAAVLLIWLEFSSWTALLFKWLEFSPGRGVLLIWLSVTGEVSVRMPLAGTGP